MAERLCCKHMRGSCDFWRDVGAIRPPGVDGGRAKKSGERGERRQCARRTFIATRNASAIVPETTSLHGPDRKVLPTGSTGDSHSFVRLWPPLGGRAPDRPGGDYDTPGSRVITDLSTDGACGCLTSQIGRDEVLSTKCGRNRLRTLMSWRLAHHGRTGGRE